MANTRVDPRIIGAALWLVLLAPGAALACTVSVVGPPAHVSDLS